MLSRWSASILAFEPLPRALPLQMLIPTLRKESSRERRGATASRAPAVAWLTCRPHLQVSVSLGGPVLRPADAREDSAMTFAASRRGGQRPSGRHSHAAQTPAPTTMSKRERSRPRLGNKGRQRVTPHKSKSPTCLNWRILTSAPGGDAPFPLLTKTHRED